MKESFSSKLQKFWSENRISLSTIIGVLSGLIGGLSAKAIFLPSGQSIDPNLIRYLSLPGLLFIRAFLILIAPLIITSLSTSFVSGRAPNKNTSDGIDAKKVLVLTFAFFIGFSCFSAFLGIGLMSTFKPGVSRTASPIVPVVESNDSALDNNIAAMQKRIEQSNFQTDSLYNILLNILPDNLLSAIFQTTYTTSEVVWPTNLSSILEPNYVPKLRTKTSHAFKTNMLGICALSIMLGLLLQQLGTNQTATILRLLQEVEALVNECMAFLLRLMPVGMFCWMFTEALKMNSIRDVAVQLVYLYAVALSGLAILLFLFYPAICFLFTRSNPYRLYSQIFPAILIALGSSSSAITLPMTMRCMQEKVGLSRPIAQSVLPLGMTLHMNGPALYYPSVALFVAQMKNIEVDIFTMVILGLFAVVMSMGFPGSPAGGAALVNHIAFASVLGIDASGASEILAYIMAFEWAMERIRTAVNITGDCYVARCIEQWTDSKGKLEENEMEVVVSELNENSTEC